MAVLASQFNSVSLNRHLSRAYRQSSVGSEGFVEVLAATQTPTDKQWFQVTQSSLLVTLVPQRGVPQIFLSTLKACGHLHPFSVDCPSTCRAEKRNVER